MTAFKSDVEAMEAFKDAYEKLTTEIGKTIVGQDEVIKKVREDVEYWLPPVKYTATRRPFKRQKKVVETEFLQEESKGYGVFLGADWPLMEAEPTSETGAACSLSRTRMETT